MADVAAKIASVQTALSDLKTAESRAREIKAQALGDLLERLRALLGNVDQPEWEAFAAMLTKALEDGQLGFFEVLSLVSFIMRAIRSPATP